MDYRQQTGEAQSWRRASGIVINNARGAVPSIAFQEEDVVTVAGHEFRNPVMDAKAGFVGGLFDPAAQIPLIDPATGIATGATATHNDLYVLLHSLYIQLAGQRDAAAASPSPVIGITPTPAA